MRTGWRIFTAFALTLAVYACASGDHSGPVGVLPEGGIFITSISPVAHEGGLALSIEGSGKLQYTVYKLENPKRLVIDIPDADSSAFTAPIDIPKGVAWQVQPHYFPKPGNSRIEIFLKDAVLYKVSRINDKKIVVDVNPYTPEVAQAVTEADTALEPGQTEIMDISLKDVQGMARLVIAYKGTKPRFAMTRRPEMNRISLDISNAKVRPANEKLLSVDAPESLVKNVAVFQFTTKPAAVKVIANLNQFTSSNVFEKDGAIYFDIGPEAVLASASEMKVETKKPPVDVSAVKEKLPSDYLGQKISLDFQDADIHNILRIIADVSGMNVITSDIVKGKVTMKLIDVPWDLALETILKNNKLAMVKSGNIIRVSTAEDLNREKEASAVNHEASVKSEVLYLKVFQINYETALKLKDNLKTIASPRGSIDVNERTNTLIIQDSRDRLVEMEKLIETLDKRTQQVLIEARIVEVNHKFARELGIKWGGNYNATTSSAFPATIGLSGVGSGGAASTSAGSIVNTGTSAVTGTLGLKLGSVDSTALLDMQLMSLQNEGKGRILSMPKISTMNNIEALIESGSEIPFQTTSADGTKTEFKKATLKLKVTPHITPDSFIRLEIEANKDEADFANQLPNSPPPILTKHAKTEVLIKDGDTTVIGGLFKEVKNESESGVPFFSKIPVLGWLFKGKTNSDSGEELLIFITPKIL